MAKNLVVSRTLFEIAETIPCPADESWRAITVTGCNTLLAAGPTELSYIGSDKYLKDFVKTKAAAVLVQRKVSIPADAISAPLLTVDDVDLSLAKALELFAPPESKPPIGVSSFAVIAESATIGKDCSISDSVHIGERSIIGNNCIFHPGAVVGDDVTIGDDCIFYPSVVLRDRVIVGSRVIIHAGTIIGTDGFGYRWDGRKHLKIPQIGSVLIEDDVEIGSCTCIDRAKFGFTRIGRGTKIDNLVQIAHNCDIGQHCIIVGQVGIAGSTKLGNGVVLGGQVGVRDHLIIGDGAMIGASAGIHTSVPPKEVYMGTPAVPLRKYLREQALLRRLPEWAVRIRNMTREMEQLKADLEKLK